MRYVGGKYRASEKITEAILANTPWRDRYLEPFVGGASVTEKLAPHFTDPVVCDFNENVTVLWEAVLRHGWLPYPEHVTEDMYREAMNDPEVSPWRSFVLFGASFGGKWRGGYGRQRGNDQSVSCETARSLRRAREALQGRVTVLPAAPYWEHTPGHGTVVYCDPPYAGTTGYATGDFDHDRFWATMDEWVSAGAHVFVSEKTGPSHWDVVWEKETTIMLNKGSGTWSDKLFHRKEA